MREYANVCKLAMWTVTMGNNYQLFLPSKSSHGREKIPPPQQALNV